MDSYVKQEEERKSRFSVENDLTKLLEQSQSNATKRNTKWVVKLFQSKKPLLCFEFNELNKQKLSENDLFETKFFSQCQNNCLHRLVSGKKHHNLFIYLALSNMDRDTATAKANYCGPGIYGIYVQRPDHNTGNYVPYSLRTVSGFFNVPQSYLQIRFVRRGLRFKTRKSNHLQMSEQR